MIVGRSIGSLAALHVALLGFGEVGPGRAPVFERNVCWHHEEALVLDSPVTCHWPLEDSRCASRKLYQKISEAPLQGIPTATWASMGKAMPACLSAGGRPLGALIHLVWSVP